MTISNIQAVKLALMPGTAEALERQATQAGNLAFLGMANGIKVARNVLYVAIGCTAIATRKAFTSEGSTIKRIGYTTLATLGIGTTALVAKILYKRTVFGQHAINNLPQPAPNTASIEEEESQR